MCEIRDKFEREGTLIILNASVSPRNDGYHPTKIMTPEQAQA